MNLKKFYEENQLLIGCFIGITIVGIKIRKDRCCCENRAAIADIKYQMATDTCALNTNIHQTGDAIINSQTAGFNMLNQTINDRFTRLEKDLLEIQLLGCIR